MTKEYAVLFISITKFKDNIKYEHKWLHLR